MGILGDSTLYYAVLILPAAGSSIFTLESDTVVELLSMWQHSTLYDPVHSLIYIPRISIENITPADSNEYTVYMRVVDENGVVGLELVEVEIEP